MIKKVFLIGNPNVGKSVIFSRLTGVHVVSSNYPGTTVEFTKGFLKLGEERIEVIDLPGAYSLEPSSPAEKVSSQLLKDSNKDEIVIIDIIDSTNLERNLFLALQLIEEGFPVVVSLNMCDDAQHQGIQIDIERLKEILGVPVIFTCGVTGLGIRTLVEQIQKALPVRRAKMTHEERWLEIGKIIESVQRLSHRHHTLKERIEDASVRPFTGFLMAAAVLYASFKVVRFIGEILINRIMDPLFYDLYQPLLDKLSLALGKSGFWHHLLIGDLINGSIDFKQSLGMLTTAPYIEFAMVLPYIISFYLVLGMLEDIGFLPRLGILLDNLMHRLGLHGFAIIPTLLGFGCNVPGILATRILESKRERFIAATLISIGVPCVPLQAMIFGLLGAYGGFYVAGVYLTLFVVWLLIGMVLNRLLKGYSPEIMIEIPPFRFPPLKILAKKTFFRISEFLFEAVPIVLAGVFIVNILLYFDLFGFFSNIFSPVVNGVFGLPKESVVALLLGFFRKDVAIGLLAPLGLSAKQMFIAVVVLAMSFPCVAAFIMLLRELGLRGLIKATLIMLLTTLLVGSALNFLILR